MPASVEQVEATLVKLGLPAARKAKIQVVWLNWGLTDNDLDDLSPAMLRVSAWRANSHLTDYGLSFSPGALVRCCESSKSTPGPGDTLGMITSDDGTKVDAGWILMRDFRNAALHGPLAHAFEEGKMSCRLDVLFHKNRNSGMCDAKNECSNFLKKDDIRTLLLS